MLARRAALEATRSAVESTTVRPEQVNGYLEHVGTSPIDLPLKLHRLALRPQVSLGDLLDHAGITGDVVKDGPGMASVVTGVEVDLKYAGYLEREHDMVRKMSQLESWPIPVDFDYEAMGNITMEAREKLTKIQPENLGQASRVSGVSPADISVLMVLLKRNGSRPRAESATP